METVSPSRMASFNHCQRQHHYGYVEKLQKKPSTSDIALDVGTLVHAALEAHYKGSLYPIPQDGGEVSLKAEAAMNAYLPFAGLNDRWEVVDVEKTFEIPIEDKPGWIFTGRLDMPVKIEGELWVVDHKTGSQHWSAERINLEAQLKLYTIAASELYNTPVRGGIYNFIRITSRAGRWHGDPLRVTLPYTEQALATAYDEMIATIDQMEAQSASSLQPTRNAGTHCKWCQFYQLCDADYYGSDRDSLIADLYQPKVRDDVVEVADA